MKGESGQTHSAEQPEVQGLLRIPNEFLGGFPIAIAPLENP